jgi:hypothetical protein
MRGGENEEGRGIEGRGGGGYIMKEIGVQNKGVE